MAQQGWTIDVNQCTGCRACEAACKVEYDLQIGQGRRRRVIEREEKDENGTPRAFFTSLACNQCAEPACLKACPVGAYVKLVPNGAVDKPWKRDENWMSSTHGIPLGAGGTSEIIGVVLHDPAKCIGCRRCEWACPYGAPQFNADTKKIHKCEGCWQRSVDTALSEERRVPACVATCIGGSIRWDGNNPTTAVESYDYGYADLPDNSAVSMGTDRDFVQAGETGTEEGVVNDGRGSSYLADWNLTKPAVKVRNRVYRKRDGGWE